MTDNLPPRFVLFDGICNLCDGAVRFIISHDPEARFMFSPLQSDTGRELLQYYELPLDDFESFVYIRSGQAYQRSTAALYVLRDLGGLWSLLYAFIIVPRFIRDAVYDLVGRNRYKVFGRKDSCMVPTPDVRKRFME